MKRVWLLFLYVGLLLCLCACSCEHDWEEATCTESKTCTKCGEKEGESLGHEWQEATCMEPKTCSRCNAIEGEALGHEWTEATCIEPKTCARCGVTEGGTSEHNWQNATYTEPKTCSVCGKTKGKPLGATPPVQHTDGESSTGSTGNANNGKNTTASSINELADKAKAKLISILKRPDSIQIYAVYAGTHTEHDGTPIGETVVIDYSAMNGFGGYNREYFRAWYNIYGEIAYDTTSYWPAYFITDSYELS